MFGAVQYGLIAACVVLFVPMGLAGWHLSRNKMLFFSGALFISLAVCVHLLPYFPSFRSTLVDNQTPILPPPDPLDCLVLLHNVVYGVDYYNASDANGFRVSWEWDRKSSRRFSDCGFEKLGRGDARDLLNGSWVVVAGDSQARLFVVSLLKLVLSEDKFESIKGDLFKRHSDYGITVDEFGMKLDFLWAPYVANLTDVVHGFKENKSYPDVLVMGAGLWHMLHLTNASDYTSSLGLLRDTLVSMLPVSPKFGMDGPVTGSVTLRSPHLFWLGMPLLINKMLKTEEKREKMTDEMCNAYDNEIFVSKILRQKGGPFFLLDIHSLSEKCGPHCTNDGMHYAGAVYETSVHIMLNELLIESQQKP